MFPQLLSLNKYAALSKSFHFAGTQFPHLGLQGLLKLLTIPSLKYCEDLATNPALTLLIERPAWGWKGNKK